jgi:hypothetical protein
MLNFEDYPWIYPPPGFIPVDKNNALAVADGSNLLEVERIEIPTRMDGWIVLAGINLAQYDDTTAFYRISQGGVPIRDYSKIKVPLGAPETPATLYIRLKPDQPVTLHITNTTGAVLAARWRLFGYYYEQRNAGFGTARIR